MLTTAGRHVFPSPARLLMNLLLIRGGYPAVAVRPADRLAYVTALQSQQAGQGSGTFDLLLYQRLDLTLSDTIAAARRAAPGQG